MFRKILHRSVLNKCTVMLLLLFTVNDVLGTELRDPTRPLSGVTSIEAQRVGRWELQSIMIGPRRRQVVINGRTLRESDTYKGLKVIKIMPNKVLVQHAGRRRELSLKTEVRKFSDAGGHD